MLNSMSNNVGSLFGHLLWKLVSNMVRKIEFLIRNQNVNWKAQGVILKLYWFDLLEVFMYWEITDG